MKFNIMFRTDVRDEELENIKIESGSKGHQNPLDILYFKL